MYVLILLCVICTPLISKAEVPSVSNIDSPVYELTIPEAIQIYTGKMLYWPDGRLITVIVLPRDNPISREFIIDTLQISPYQFYESLDISITIRKNNSVIRASSENEVIRNILRNSGSIGYVSDYIYYNYKNEVRKIRVK